MLVQVSVANTISVTKNRDGLGPLLDGPDELVGSPGDDEVDVVVQLQQVVHLDQSERIIVVT